MTRPTDRRSFVSTLGLSVAGATLLANPLEAMPPREIAAAPWDLSWLDDFKGVHRQVFDFDGRHPMTDGNPLRVPRNWLNAHREVYNLSGKDLNVCIGITSESFPMNAADPLWVQYPIGEHWKIKDPDTGEWAKRNLWLDKSSLGSAETSIRGLQARGTVFWQCNNALNGVVAELVTVTGGTTEKIRADLIAGLNPGVKLVPAHTMLVGLVQERKFTYQKL